MVLYNHKETINNIKVKEETKMMNISKEVMERINLYWNEITGYMADDIREWTHSRYCEEQNWKFLKEYFLRLVCEYGEEEGEAFDTLLWQEFNIDIDDLVTDDEKQEAITEYENKNN